MGLREGLLPPIYTGLRALLWRLADFSSSCRCPGDEACCSDGLSFWCWRTRTPAGCGGCSCDESEMAGPCLPCCFLVECWWSGSVFCGCSHPPSAPWGRWRHGRQTAAWLSYMGSRPSPAWGKTQLKLSFSRPLKRQSGYPIVKYSGKQ